MKRRPGLGWGPWTWVIYAVAALVGWGLVFLVYFGWAVLHG